MNIISSGFKQSLLELLENGNLNQFYIEVNRAFRFTVPEQEYWKDFARLETHILFSQMGEHIPQGLGLVAHAIKTETGINEASEILQNAAWYEGPNLGRVVRYSGKIMDGSYPLSARQHAADALKNAAAHQGPHLPDAVRYALKHGYLGSPRMCNACVRTIQYASEHSRELLQTEEVRELLEIRSGDENKDVSRNAAIAYKTIFGVL